LQAEIAELEAQAKQLDDENKEEVVNPRKKREQKAEEK
jgi:hypothetical protein